MQGLWQHIDAAAPNVRRGWTRFVVAVAAAMMALLMAYVSHATLGTHLPFLFGLSAVFASALYGGLAPALVTSALSLVLLTAVLEGDGNMSDPAILVIILISAAASLAGEVILRLRERAAEQTWRLGQREDYLKTILISQPAPVIVFDDYETIIASNRAAERLFGHEAGALDGTQIRQHLDLPCTSASDQLGTLAARYEMCGEVIETRSRTGATLQLGLGLTSTRLGGHRVHTLYLRDETDARKAKQQQAELQLEVQQLGRAVALGQLGSAISHELNQPLAAAANFVGAARTFLAQGETPRAEKAVGDTLVQIFRASAILRGLRNFVRATPPELNWTEVRHMVDEAVSLAGLVVRHAGAKLSVRVSEEVDFLHVDRIQIQQVLLNLIANSADAVAGRRDPQITLSVDLDRGGMAIVSVSDNGPGVSRDQRHRLFKPFSTGKRDGLGVGLAISRSIIEAHGGRIHYRDVPGGGASFAFTVRHEYSERVVDAA